MIPWVERYAQTRWQEWTGTRPRRLRSALLTASRHAHQRCTVLLRDRIRNFQVAVKLGWSESTRKGIDAEFRALKAAQRSLPQKFVATLPSALDLVTNPSFHALFTRVVAGQLPAIPELLKPADRAAKSAVDRYLELTIMWSGDLSRATRTLGTPEDSVAEYRVPSLPGVSTNELAMSLPPERAWQHGDPAPGNALIKSGDVRLIDWEHASPARLPWHDVAYLVPVMALIAARQATVRSVEAFDALFRPGSWSGEMIRGRIAESWAHSTEIGAAVSITALQVAFERGDSNPAWNDLAHHLLSGKGPPWLRA